MESDSSSEDSYDEEIVETSSETTLEEVGSSKRSKGLEDQEIALLLPTIHGVSVRHDNTNPTEEASSSQTEEVLTLGGSKNRVKATTDKKRKKRRSKKSITGTSPNNRKKQETDLEMFGEGADEVGEEVKEESPELEHQKKVRFSDDVYLNWTSPHQKSKQLEWENWAREIEAAATAQKKGKASIAASAITDRSSADKLSSGCINKKDIGEVNLNRLLVTDDDKERLAIYQGTELQRQRRAVPRGPVSVEAEFGNIKMKDVAAVDCGATHNFISKSWLYEFLKKGGKMKVHTFDRKGHETFDGTCFYTFGVVELDVHLNFGDGRERTFPLRANVAKDGTAMYNVLLGTEFIAESNLIVAVPLNKIFLVEDFPEGLLVKGSRIKVKWSKPIKDVFACEDIRMPKNMEILTQAELQDILLKKKKQRKDARVNACVIDKDKTYAFVPKKAPTWCEVVNAMTIVQPRAREEEASTQKDRGLVRNLLPTNTEIQDHLKEDRVIDQQSSSLHNTSTTNPIILSDGSDNESMCSFKTGRDGEEQLEFDDLDDEESVIPYEEEGLTKSMTNSLQSVPTIPPEQDGSSTSSGKETEANHEKAKNHLSSNVGGFTIPIQLANHSDEPAVIRKGTYLGQLYEVEEESIDVQVQMGGKEKENFASRYTAEELDKLIEVLKIKELDIEDEHKERLVRVVKSYANVFAKSSEEVGHVHLMEVGIDVEGHPPVRVKPYRVSPTERNVIKVEVEKMLRAGIIKPSTSPWASPVVLVPKPDGSVRFAIDFRKLNNITRKETYPMPNIQDYLDVLKGNEYFTIADGQQAYFGLPMSKEAQPLTAFICHLGQYEFVKMPFGLCNAPAIYQRLMNSVLQGMLWEECLVYLDDICIMSPTVGEHIDRFERLLQRLAAAGILLKPSKCHLLQKSIKLLGHIVDKDGTRPVKAKVQAIKEMPIKSRSDLHTFLGMTGYYSQYCPKYAEVTVSLRKALHGKGPFSVGITEQTAIDKLKNILMTEPLLEHPDWDLPFEIHCDASNYALGVVLCQIIDGRERVIGYYSRVLRDSEKNYDVTQKECLAVVWAVKKLRPYLYGREFVIKTDHAALKWLLNLPPKDHTGRLMRWALLLQDYMFVVKHRAGRSHGNADALSRLIDTTCLQTQKDPSILDEVADVPNKKSLAASILSAITRTQARQNNPEPSSPQQAAEIAIATRKASQGLDTQRVKRKRTDTRKGHTKPSNQSVKRVRIRRTPLLEKGGEEINHISEQAEKTAYDTIAAIIREEQSIDPVIKNIKAKFPRDNRMDLNLNGILYRLKNFLLYQVKVTDVLGKRTECELLLVPKSLQQEMIRLHHDHPTAGHFGADKTLKRLKQRYTWYRMSEMVSEYVRTCKACQRNNHKELKNAASRPVIPRGPFDIVAIDCLALPNSVHGNEWVFVAIDYFTKYANTYVIRGPRPTANDVLRCLVKYISQHALVRAFRCDRGSEFCNTIFTEAFDQLGVDVQFIPTEHHRANGLVERFNRTLQNSLCKVLDETVQLEMWEEYLDWVTLAYNTSFHPTIQDTPFFIVYGRHAILPGDMWMFSKAKIDEEDQPIDLGTYKKDMMARFAMTYTRVQKQLRQHYDRILKEANQQKKVSFEIGDQVWVYQPEIQARDGVRKKLTYQWHGPMIVAETHPESTTLYRVLLSNRERRTDGWIHVNRLRTYRGRESKPTDVVLPVPSYDLSYDDLPLSSQLDEMVVSERRKRKRKEQQVQARKKKRSALGKQESSTITDDNKYDSSSDNDDPEFEFIEHPERTPTEAELSLIGKVFLNKKGTKRYKVYAITYYKPRKAMVAQYKEQERVHNRWVDTGDSDSSSIPEVMHWIERSASRLYPMEA